jgi:cytidine deaminase
MEFKSICTLHYEEDMERVKEGDQLLLLKSRESRAMAYAPYSKFQVGAALLLENGKIILGNNQENAAYPSGLCAERVALHHAGSNYPGIAIKSLAISLQANGALQLEDKLISPCGGCLQVLSEFEKRQSSEIRIVLQGGEGVLVAEGVKQFLPFQFKTKSIQ